MVEVLLSLVTLTLLEIVLGVDNIIFIAILVGRVPHEHRLKARAFGLIIALVFRIILLCSLSWLIGMTAPLFELFGHGFSGRDLILLGGGLFLVAKSTLEIHHKIEDAGKSALVNDSMSAESKKDKHAKFRSIVGQIVIVDIVFSFDSIITAVGMARDVRIMIAAVVLSMIIMILVSGKISDFIDRHPTIKMLALSFLVLIGVLLLVEGMGQHVSKGYVYFAMAFSLAVESLNIQYRKRAHQK